MKRNLRSNRQLRNFNSLISDYFRDDQLYMNAIDNDFIDHWINMSLEKGEQYLYCHAKDKAWFHRCGVMVVYCGIKEGSAEDGAKLRYSLLQKIRNKEYKCEVENSNTEGNLFQIAIYFDRPRWHELDMAKDCLDKHEILLFACPPSKEEAYTIGMLDDWYDEKADYFFQRSQTDSVRQGCIHNYLFQDREGWERSEINLTKQPTGCVINYLNSSNQVIATFDFLPIGTYSTDSNTFLWAWNNEGWLSDYRLNEKLAQENKYVFQKLTQVKSISSKYGFNEFEAKKPLQVEEFESWEFTRMACRELNGQMPYRIPGEFGHAYGVMFYQDKDRKKFSNSFVELIHNCEEQFKDFLNQNTSLYESSSVEFAQSFLRSDMGPSFQDNFNRQIQDKDFLAVLKLRVFNQNSEEERFKEVFKLLLRKNGLND